MAPIPTAAQTPLRRWSLRPWWIGAGWAAALVTAASVGYLGVGMTRPKPDTTDRDLMRDLRVIENLRFYAHVDDLDFLKSLDKPDLFGDDASGSER
jgi:hypothetical protein